MDDLQAELDKRFARMSACYWNMAQWYLQRRSRTLSFPQTHAGLKVGYTTAKQLCMSMESLEIFLKKHLEGRE